MLTSASYCTENIKRNFDSEIISHPSNGQFCSPSLRAPDLSWYSSVSYSPCFNSEVSVHTRDACFPQTCEE